jgi:uncharacterized membrane protein HdeD (DUF308 family)
MEERTKKQKTGITLILIGIIGVILGIILYIMRIVLGILVIYIFAMFFIGMGIAFLIKIDFEEDDQPSWI